MSINSQNYCEILAYSSTLNPSGWILEQDGATPHMSVFFVSRFWQVLQRPPNNLDVKAIENVWGILKNYVERENPKNEQELIEYMQEFQHQITLEMRENVMGSITKRLSKYSENRGNIVRTGRHLL